MKIVEAYITKNDCYQRNLAKDDSRYTTFQNRGPLGLMLHSVGCAQPSAKVFADGWNQPGKESSVHAVLQSDGIVYQLMPWNFRAWHCGGDANNTHIGVEMTEPACIKYTGGASFTCSDLVTARAHAEGCYKTARDLFAYLCDKFNLDPMKDIISHAEGSKKGVASNHADPEHLWKGLGMSYTMDGFRKDVKAKMAEMGVSAAEPVPPVETAPRTLYRVQAGAFTVRANAEAFLAQVKAAGFTNAFITQITETPVEPVQPASYVVRVVPEAGLNIRKTPSTEAAIMGVLPENGMYTIVEERDGWGRLKSGAGWILLMYTQRA